MSHMFSFFWNLFMGWNLFIYCVCMRTYTDKHRKWQKLGKILTIYVQDTWLFIIFATFPCVWRFSKYKAGGNFILLFHIYGFYSLGKNFPIFKIIFVLFFKKAENAQDSLGHISVKSLITLCFLFYSLAFWLYPSLTFLLLSLLLVLPQIFFSHVKKQ